MTTIEKKEEVKVHVAADAPVLKRASEVPPCLGAREDFYNTNPCDTCIEKVNILDIWKDFNGSYILQANEHIIFDTCRRYLKHTKEGKLLESRIVICIVTNLSNFVRYDSLYEVFDNTNYGKVVRSVKYCSSLATVLDAQYIKLLNQTITFNNTTMSSKDYTVVTKCIDEYANNIYDILAINKANVENVQKLTKEYEFKYKKLLDSIPSEHLCKGCNSYLNKKFLCLPCTHHHCTTCAATADLAKQCGQCKHAITSVIGI